MPVNLKWKHQQETYEIMKEHLKFSKKAAFSYPPSGGKSFPPLKLLEEPETKDKKVLYLVSSIFAIEQFKSYIAEFILNDKNANVKKAFKNWYFITYDKLRTFDIYKLKFDIIISDETHRVTGAVWEIYYKKLLENNPDAIKIGMTATPRRTDGRNMLEEYFGNDIIYTLSIHEALSGEKTGEVSLKPSIYVRVLSEADRLVKLYKKRIDLLSEEERKRELYKKYEKIRNTLDVADNLEETYKKYMREERKIYNFL